MSSFRGKDIFGSGPHRFSFGVRGLDVQPLFRLFNDSLLSGTAAIGDLEIEVGVKGRLIAPSDAQLWLLRQGVAVESGLNLGTGTLIDDRGRAITEVRLIRYEELGPVDVGRTLSIGYTATFRRTRETF